MNFDGQHSLEKLYGNLPKQGETDPAKDCIQGIKHHGGGKHVQFSEDQQSAFISACDFMLDNERFMSLVGPAGSGKSFLMKAIATEAKKRRWKLSLAAPTHKAVAQLADSAGFDAETIHRVLGVTVKENNRTGERELKSSGEPSLEAGSFLIVDESSMLQLELLELIRESAEDMDCKVLFVGDMAQLNPVGEEPCVAVDPEQCPWKLVSLTTIHRQAAQNPIIKAATAVRLANPDCLPALLDERNDGLGIHVMEKRAWAELMLNRCALAEETNDRYIGYTNVAVDAAAKRVREIKYGIDASEPYLKGELLVVNERYTYSYRKKKRDGSEQKFKEVVENNTEIIVKNVWRDGDFYIVYADCGGKTIEFKAFENYQRRKRYLDRLAGAAKREKGKARTEAWKKFWAANNTIADLRSAVSLSVHKAQGSTFRDVFLNCSQIGFCRDLEERQRLAYVAITRASRAVYITGDWS